MTAAAACAARRSKTPDSLGPIGAPPLLFHAGRERRAVGPCAGEKKECVDIALFHRYEEDERLATGEGIASLIVAKCRSSCPLSLRSFVR